MEIGGRSLNGFHVVDVVGKIDRLRDSIVLKSYVNTLLEQGTLHIAMNLAKVTYLDSGALNVLIYCRNTLHKRKGEFILIEPNEYVNDVLEVVGLHKLVRIYSKEEDFEHDTQSA